MKATLLLEDGTTFTGEGIGAPGEVHGEICFCTSMTGYQEALTDPSYAGQILVLTYPLVGNYGIDPERYESDGIQVEGFVVREACQNPDHPSSRETLGAFLRREDIPGITGVDTRALTLKIRERGVMKASLHAGEKPVDPEALLARNRRAPEIGERDLVSRVTREQPAEYPGEGSRIAVLDLGMKHSIRDNLVDRECEVRVLPADTSAAGIREHKPDGLVISPGPGDPARLESVQETLRELMGELPMFGICLGHQVLALAVGATTYKLKYGHRGANQPVKDLNRDRVYMTAQNHGYAVDRGTIPETEFEVDKVNLNDDTVEGMVHRRHDIMTVQYHPEAHPGPLDSQYLFDDFLEMVHRAGC